MIVICKKWQDNFIRINIFHTYPDPIGSHETYVDRMKNFIMGRSNQVWPVKWNGVDCAFSLLSDEAFLRMMALKLSTRASANIVAMHCLCEAAP